VTVRLAEIACYLFDLDGTLVDSSPAHDRAYRDVLRREHPELLARFDYRAVAGLTTPAAFRSLGLSDGEAVRCALLKQKQYRAAVEAGRVPEMPGAGLLLAQLKAGGNMIGVVTSASRISALNALETNQLMAHVDVVVAAEDARETKPAPAPFLQALTKLRADAAQSVAIEDAPSGFLSARAAGLKVIGVHQNSVRALSDLYFEDFAAFREALA
jgi:HAD superfamily hydrolase (TIGR01509 family)